jgi:hypothetical protein
VHPIGIAEQGDVDVVVDDEQRCRPGGQFADPSRQSQELSPGQGFVTQLQDVRSSTQRSSRQLNDTVAWRVRSNDVQVSGGQPL